MKVSLSKKVYSSKSQAKEELHKKDGDFIWREIDLTPYELYEKLLEGYCFSPATYGDLLSKELLFNSGKGVSLKNTKTGGTFYLNPFDNDGCVYKWARKQERWSEAQCMFIDIDGCDKSIEEYVRYLSIKPTFGFYTPNDKPEKRRFKLVYCFNHQINDRSLWCYVAEVLTNLANNTNTDLDPCGKIATQMSFQSNGEGKWLGYIVNLENLDYSRLPEFLNEMNKEGKIKDIFKIDDNIEKYLNVRNKYRGKNQSKSNWAWKKMFKYFNLSNLLIYNTTNEIKDVPVYNPVLDSEQNNIVQLTTEDYWELKQTPRKDGEHRRRTLYRRMILRRILGELNKINITPELLLVNAVIDRETFIDNSDSEISMKCLKDLVKDAWCKDLEKVKKSETINHIIDYLKNEAPEYKFSGNKIGLKQYEVVSISLKYRGYLYQTILDYCFDSNKSIKENTEDINKALENKGWKIRISERTIYKYKGSELKASKSTRDEFIMAKYSEGLSATKINESLVSNGFDSMSKSQINRIIKKLKEQEPKESNDLDPEKEQDLEINLDPTYFLSGWGKL